MRSIAAIALFLVGLGLVSCQLKGTSAEPRSEQLEASWVRTIDGWERAGNWQPTDDRGPALHPLVVASGQLLLSVFALVAFADNPRFSFRP